MHSWSELDLFVHEESYIWIRFIICTWRVLYTSWTWCVIGANKIIVDIYCWVKELDSYRPPRAQRWGDGRGDGRTSCTEYSRSQRSQRPCWCRGRSPFGPRLWNGRSSGKGEARLTSFKGSNWSHPPGLSPTKTSIAIRSFHSSLGRNFWFNHVHQKMQRKLNLEWRIIIAYN